MVNGIRQDFDAVTAGLSMQWNSGRVEGNVNRIKRIKRDGYGRPSISFVSRSSTQTDDSLGVIGSQQSDQNRFSWPLSPGAAGLLDEPSPPLTAPELAADHLPSVADPADMRLATAHRHGRCWTSRSAVLAERDNGARLLPRAIGRVTPGGRFRGIYEIKAADVMKPL
ncbi:hypothetical protein [Actinomadura sp. 3N508]|uniref:hypothetical protein n=1 Tax=Actinomadura sp. 3N508 TaxID=3375153 RepID=UPI00378E0543